GGDDSGSGSGTGSGGSGSGSGGGDDSGSGSGTGSGGSGSGSGGGTHTGGSGNEHGGGGTSLDGDENGDKNGSGHEMGDGLNDYDFGDLDTSTNLPDPKDIKDVPKNEVDLGGFGISGYFDASSQCPAPTTVDLKLFGTLEISYEYFCSIARILRAVVIAFAWLSALLIIARINRG
ncbi:MAG: hypothetical protein J6U05_06225, partial [Neisseriaceae bacterium]|nr:hypothetical protein [Neisseriaceae bacterium]